MAGVTVFGGTGFLGREIVRAVSAGGFDTRIATRHAPRESREGANGRVTHVIADVNDAGSVQRAVEGAFAVVNAVSLYVEKGGVSFEDVHVDGARRIARCAGEAGAEVLVHVSGVGSELASPSAFVRARARGEEAVRAAFGEAVVTRPCVMFGRHDSFLSAVEMATRLPVVPLFGRGETRLQPAFVKDVAAAVAKVIAEPARRARVFELGGAEVLTYREVVEAVMAHLGRRRVLVPVPFAAWKGLAAALERLPSPPLTRDQVVLMESDNVVTGRTAAFSGLGIGPAGLSAMLRECLAPRR
ncbi:MAG TPA: complex I NDUFA9 subunit family protein [Woeseiaceae bacterium]|nr:complex I NDUFA9 subunit family protein [Woeseiaceae bacterium]